MLCIDIYAEVDCDVYLEGRSINFHKKAVSVAQLVVTVIICSGGRVLNPGFSTSPHIMCVILVTRLLDKKKITNFLFVF